MKILKPLLASLFIVAFTAAASAQVGTTPPTRTVTKPAITKIDREARNKKLLMLQADLTKLEKMLNDAVKLLDKLKDTKDSISEMSEEDMMTLQILLDKRTQVENMISNVMKAFSETQSTITNNMK